VLLALLPLGGVLRAQDDRPHAATYTHALSTARQMRDTLRSRLAQAETDSARAAIEEEAGNQLTSIVCEILLPAWIDTPWSFDGMTVQPGEGTIACGYFVTTLLRDAGCALDRIRLAQVPSETMIRELLAPESIQRFSDTPIDRFLRSVLESGPGLFIVGLDCHVGFIRCDDSNVRFVHSSYMSPWRVVDEPARQSRILAGSRYRVLGKLANDEVFLNSWLVAESVPAAPR